MVQGLTFYRMRTGSFILRFKDVTIKEARHLLICSGLSRPKVSFKDFPNFLNPSQRSVNMLNSDVFMFKNVTFATGPVLVLLICLNMYCE